MAKRRSYTLEFKQEAVRLVLEQGMSPAEVGRDLGVCRTVIGSWVKKARANALAASPTATAPTADVRDMEAELRALRKENARLREEREILKKAAAFFAKETR